MRGAKVIGDRDRAARDAEEDDRARGVTMRRWRGLGFGLARADSRSGARSAATGTPSRHERRSSSATMSDVAVDASAALDVRGHGCTRRRPARST